LETFPKPEEPLNGPWATARRKRRAGPKIPDKNTKSPRKKRRHRAFLTSRPKVHTERRRAYAETTQGKKETRSSRGWKKGKTPREREQPSESGCYSGKKLPSNTC